MGEMSFEETRRLIKKEYKAPNSYSVNRVTHLLERVSKEHGNGAKKELQREFGIRKKEEK